MDATKQKALRLLDRRDYSRRELVRKLMEKGEPQEAAEAVADRFVELGLINDRRYSHILVRHYAAKGFGVCRIKQELYRHGIPTDMWEDALTELPTQEEIMDKLFRQKLGSGVPDRARIKKATDAMLRRGFSWSEIESCRRRVLEGMETEESE